MKKVFIFSVIGMLALCFTGCKQKNDTCCKVSISANSDATITRIYLDESTTIGYYPGKYYIPYDQTVYIDFEITFQYESFSGGYYDRTISATKSFSVGQANELEVKVGSYTEGYSDTPSPCIWVGGKMIKY